MTVRISTSGLGKSYRIKHAAQPTYSRLSEELVKFAKNPLRKVMGSRGATEEFWALKDVDFQINHGEVVGVVGRNGAGKSTLLKLLSRITEPSKGRIELNGRVASLLEVGTGFHPELTGRENVFLNGAILGMSKVEIRSKFDEIIAFAEIERFLDTPVKRYSSGMYVRLAFAVAAHLEPEILVVDEVLAVGDAQFQKKCIGKMSSVAESGRTVLFVSHQMGAVSQLCTRCLYLKSGSLLSDGPTDDVIGQYLSDASNSTGISNRTRHDVGEDTPVWFTSTSTRNLSGNRTASFTHDEPISLRLEFANHSGTWPRGLVCTICLQDTLNRRVFSDNFLLGDRAEAAADCRLDIHLPKGLIAPGNYSFITTLHTFQGETFDRLGRACEISIIDGGSKFAKYKPGSYGCVIAPCKWKIGPSHNKRHS